jgi:hypothetical protein
MALDHTLPRQAEWPFGRGEKGIASVPDRPPGEKRDPVACTG